MTLSEAKEIAKTIHEYVEEKRQEPTGNQNCLLCVWCSEARFRGFRVLPRPVYSPRDSIFKHHEHGLDIVHDAVKESISSKRNVLMMQDTIVMSIGKIQRVVTSFC